MLMICMKKRSKTEYILVQKCSLNQRQPLKNQQAIFFTYLTAMLQERGLGFTEDPGLWIITMSQFVAVSKVMS
jgi:hypothetical protein